MLLMFDGVKKLDEAIEKNVTIRMSPSTIAMLCIGIFAIGIFFSFPIEFFILRSFLSFCLHVTF